MAQIEQIMFIASVLVAAWYAAVAAGFDWLLLR
jgi:hypothetical protein